MKPILEFFLLVVQFILPHHMLSRLAGFLADCKWPWLKDLLIRQFIKAYDVNMAEAKESLPQGYTCFNDFFTRALKHDARPFIDADGSIACPVDGAISQIGNIVHDRIYQAKGHEYTTLDLLGGSHKLANQFEDGQFATIYLAPKDYHRIHMPADGTLQETIYVPGRLYSVSPFTTAQITGLFARNERLVNIFDTKHGPMAIIMIGAMIVASIETVWAGLISPPKRQLKQQIHTPIMLEKGDEMGRFKLGSTVILLFGKDQVEWANQAKADKSVRMGQLLGNARS